jgi:hypothetical protein
MRSALGCDTMSDAFAASIWTVQAMGTRQACFHRHRAKLNA